MKGNGKEWFDGYENQKVILMEDLDLGGRSLGHLIKLWADEYAVSAEIKGGHIWLRHEWFIVTSNFSPEEIFGPDVDKQSEKQQAMSQKMVDAIKARFLVIDTTGMPERRQTCEPQVNKH